MKQIIIAVTVISVLAGCKKLLTVSETEHYISGYLYNDCGGAPAKNRGLYMYRPGTRLEGETTKGTCTTDSTGYFKMNYKANDSGDDLELRFANSNYAIVYLPSNPIVNIDNAKLYGVSTCSITVKLNVTNPKTTADTLYVTNLNVPGTYLKIPGPFANGTTIYTANNFNLLVPQYKKGTTSKFIKVGYYFILGQPLYFDLDAEPCKNNIVTINVN